MVPIGNDGVPFLSGTVPGVVDPSQSSRLLRTATCTLSFATFDPNTADTSPFLSGRKETQHPGASSSLPPGECFNEVTTSTRIVIEMDSQKGTCTWRFVPPAITERNRLGNEGPWPKSVILCGQIVRITQDQWDIYKLDPHYDCIMRDFPFITTITRASHAPSTISPVNGLTLKRERGLSPTRQMSLDGDSFKLGHEEPAKDQLPPEVNDETRKLLSIDAMPVDGPPVAFSKSDLHEPVNPVNGLLNSKTNYGTRKEPSMDAMSIDGESFYLSATVPSQENANTKKRTRTSDSGPSTRQSRVHDDRDFEEPPKRFRSRSPQTIRREISKKRAAREARRTQRLAARIKARNAALHESFWKDIGADSSSDEGDETEVDDSTPERRLYQERKYTSRFENSRRRLADENVHGLLRTEICEEEEEFSVESDLR